MVSEPVPEAKSILKNPLLYTTAVVLVVLAGVTFVMVSRWQDRRNIERQAAEARTEKQRAQDRLAVEQLGGKEFAILSFYASPGTIRRGEAAQLCYGVANAKSVQLEPQTEAVWPSMARCVSVKPVKSTTYTLTIEDGTGKTQSADVEIKVQ